jgi:hypothetical protein
MRGKIAILFMIMLAVAAAGFAWSWNYQRSARARAFWGAKAATIRFADKVEAFRITLPKDASDRAYLHPEPGGIYQFAEPAIDIGGAPGLLNARTSLMADDGFDWSVESFTPKPSGEWKWGVRFLRDGDTATLLFSDRRDVMLVAEFGKAIALDPKTAAGWKQYLEKALVKQRSS